MVKNYTLACICAVLLAGSLLFPAPVRAASIYYVSTLGNDLNPGTLERPFRTIQKGINKLAAGDTLYIRGGTYTERIKISVSGSTTAPITISSYPGEAAVLDGNGLPPISNDWNHMVEISGSYIILENLEITYPQGWGVLTSQTATHDYLLNLNVHHLYRSAFNIWGSYNTIANSRIWKTNLVNDPSINPGSGDWSGSLSFGDTNPGHGNYGSYTTVRNNFVYDNYGEGILCMYTDNSLIEGNTVFDNWAMDIYLDQCSYATVRNNLVYYTTNREYWRFADYPAAAIEFSNEGIISYPVGHDRKIYNNIIVNAGVGVSFWTGKVTGSALINDMIANNTIVNNYMYGLYGFGFDFGAPNGSGVSHQNTLIENNLVSVLNMPANSPSMAGLTFSHNLWSHNPDPAYRGSGDIVGNPKLSNPAHSVDTSIDPGWYALTSTSPAIGKALVLMEVQTDYFGTARDASPDMGACEVPSIPDPADRLFLPVIMYSP